MKNTKIKIWQKNLNLDLHMEISPTSTAFRSSANSATTAQPFELDERKEPFGIDCPYPSPFSPPYVFTSQQTVLEKSVDSL